jgi:hypothetical protein
MRYHFSIFFFPLNRSACVKTILIGLRPYSLSGTSIVNLIIIHFFSRQDKSLLLALFTIQIPREGLITNHPLLQAFHCCLCTSSFLFLFLFFFFFLGYMLYNIVMLFHIGLLRVCLYIGPSYIILCVI